MASGSDNAASGIPFGRYLLRERIAQGGMGEVFRAVAIGASGFEKPVVVKRILPQLQAEERLAAMFVDEARLMSRLAHPNIVQVIDFGQGADRDYFLVLELVEGVDLGRLREHFSSRAEPVPIALALYVTQQMLRGLGHAHEKAYDDGRVLVHRDVSPGNVLLSTVGEVKIGDFGVALAREPDEVSGAARLVVGKLGYMAPEQHAGEPVDPRADLFSVAVVLFELLTHERPFVGRTPGERQAAAALGRARPAAPLRADVTPELDALLAKALSRSPDDRFPTARAMAAAVAALRDAGHPVAGADDLAEAVEQARAAAAPRGKPVLLLGADPGDEAPPVGELTRTGAARFTMRLGEGLRSAADEPGRSVEAPGAPARRPEQDPEAGSRSLSTLVDGARGPSRKPARRAALLGVAAAGVTVAAVVVAIGGSWPPGSGREMANDRAAGDDRTDRLEAGTVDVAGEAAGSSGAAATGGGPSTTEQRVATRATSTASSREPAQRSAATGPTAAAASARAEDPPADTSGAAPSATSRCEGDVHLYASHGWTVSGGPSTVQAPGRYKWPCGSYALRALSRLDPGVTEPLSVVVRQGQTAVVDLRR